MSKGSRPRPIFVSNEEYENRWDAIFGRHKDDATKSDSPEQVDNTDETVYNDDLTSKEP